MEEELKSTKVESTERKTRTTRTRRTNNDSSRTTKRTTSRKANENNTTTTMQKRNTRGRKTAETKENKNGKTEEVQKRKNTNTRRTNKNTNKDFGFKKETIKIIPLGGLHEIGKNITVFEYGDDIVLVDAGLAFPDDDMLGVDLVIPDLTYLERNKEKIRGSGVRCKTAQRSHRCDASGKEK